MPREALEARLAGLPAGVSVEPGRIEVRFSSAQDAVGRLFALAQALTNDYERFEELVEGGRPGRRRGSGAGMNEDVVRVELTDIARTALAPRAELVLPRLIVSRGTSPRHRRPSSRHRYRVTPALVSPSSMRASVLLHRCTQEYHGPPSEYKGLSEKRFRL